MRAPFVRLPRAQLHNKAMATRLCALLALFGIAVASGALRRAESANSLSLSAGVAGAEGASGAALKTKKKFGLKSGISTHVEGGYADTVPDPDSKEDGAKIVKFFSCREPSIQSKIGSDEDFPCIRCAHESNAAKRRKQPCKGRVCKGKCVEAKGEGWSAKDIAALSFAVSQPAAAAKKAKAGASPSPSPSTKPPRHFACAVKSSVDKAPYDAKTNWTHTGRVKHGDMHFVTEFATDKCTRNKVCSYCGAGKAVGLCQKNHRNKVICGLSKAAQQ